MFKKNFVEVAQEFSKILTNNLAAEEMTEIIIRNEAEADDSICHSHDFCDPNMYMMEAIMNITGMEQPDSETESYCKLWSDSWDLAKTASFNFQFLKETDGHRVDSDWKSVKEKLKAFGFENSSWINDTAPSFTKISDDTLRIFVNPKHLNSREMKDCRRFGVFRENMDGYLIQTDSLNELLDYLNLTK